MYIVTHVYTGKEKRKDRRGERKKATKIQREKRENIVFDPNLNTSSKSGIMHTWRCEFSATKKCRCVCNGHMHAILRTGTVAEYETIE